MYTVVFFFKLLRSGSTLNSCLPTRRICIYAQRRRSFISIDFLNSNSTEPKIGTKKCFLEVKAISFIFTTPFFLYIQNMPLAPHTKKAYYCVLRIQCKSQIQIDQSMLFGLGGLYHVDRGYFA